eukprot:CAMPEP_0172589122 /NCGR_PEP_ID=MMETSP1068-20121228/7931_1 /TAXON_ID=35684 /ORGANISM="Pseudopedinella elastica, Strain CCMP716" /LENGTH=111 /DNA_ID=CAMNT_0013384651 /DNA_START=384 /DNA_END=719 /DNA_ORIENTATION=-
MFDVVLISERLSEPGTQELMQKHFGPAVKGAHFPQSNRGQFTHDRATDPAEKVDPARKHVDAKMRAVWQRSLPMESLRLMLQLNSLDIKLYWFADRLLNSRIDELKGTEPA